MKLMYKIMECVEGQLFTRKGRNQTSTRSYTDQSLDGLENLCLDKMGEAYISDNKWKGYKS